MVAVPSGIRTGQVPNANRKQYGRCVRATGKCEDKCSPVPKQAQMRAPRLRRGQM